MATYSVIKLSGITQIHIGTGRETYDFSATDLCSDTLLSALASMMAMKGDSAGIEQFLASTRLSSAFPYYRDHLFFPIPQGRLNIVVDGKEPHQYRKMLKKVKFMEFPLWKEMILGKEITIKMGQICDNYIISSSTVLPENIYKTQVAERVSVPRDDALDSEPFFFEWKYFEKDAGLFVVTDSTGEQLGKVLSLLEALGQQGLGTDKSVGGGKFDVHLYDVVSFDVPEDSNDMMLLSLYLPTSDELAHIDLESSRYSLLLRGGFMAGSQEEKFHHLRKKSVYMIDAGSVLHTQFPIKGKIVDLRPEWNDSAMHPVFRSGMPIYIPIKV